MIFTQTIRKLQEIADETGDTVESTCKHILKYEEIMARDQGERRSNDEDKVKIHNKLQELDKAGRVTDDLLRDRRARADIIAQAGARRNQGTMGFTRIAIQRILLLTHQPTPRSNGGDYRHHTAT
jgi:hypothetical protein